MKFLNARICCVMSLLFLLLSDTYSQKINPIITAFPSLRIAPSSRGFAMGDAGIAAASGNEALYYNASRTAFTQNFHQVGIGFTPWLSTISNDTRFLYANYLANTGSSSALGFALNYLRTGNVQTRDNNGALIAETTASEFSLLTSFAIQLSDRSAIGGGLRFLSYRGGIVPDPTGTLSAAKSILSVSADLSYSQMILLSSEGQRIEIGAVITNLGPKISVNGSDYKIFLPTNLGIGIAYVHPLVDDVGSITLALDANKLLVPTPPEHDISGNIVRGKDANRSVLKALFSSFNDAPGGFKEELREIRLNAGIEFAYDKTFFLRCGLSFENKTKGNRKFIGLGVGYKGAIDNQSYGIDFHYLVPFGAVAAISPFQNIWGFSVQVNIGNFQ